MFPQEMAERHSEKLRRLLLTAPEPALVMWDANAVITGWLMGAEKVFGYSAAEAVGQPASLLYTPEDRELGIPEYEINVALARGHSENDRWMQRKDGVRFWASGALSVIRDTDGELLGFGKSLTNRTDFKGKIDALENLIESQRQAEATRGLAISTLAHELRGPLSAVAYAVEAANVAGCADEIGRSAMEIIERQCRSMSRLIEDLLDATRLRFGKMRLDRTRISLAQVAEDAIQTCRGPMAARNQHLEFISPAGTIWIDGDPQRLSQVVINLLQNASKFTRDAGTIWVKLSNEGNDAVVRVEDNGVGISPEALPRIFEMFAQAEPLSGSQNAGLGIGLAVVKEVVELHGGTVQVRSDGLGKGSEFTVRLPLADITTR